MQTVDLASSLDESIFALVYGASGSGKTHLIGTLAELGRVLVIDVDKGAKTLASAKDLQPWRKNITVASFDKFKDLDDAYKHTKENSKEKWTKLFGVETEPFDWIVWDTWSELQWHMMQELRRKENMSGATLDFRKNIQIQHWGMMTDLNKLSIESFRDCTNVHQIFTMQEVLTKDDLSGQIYGGPAIHGKMVQEMPQFFDVVVRTYTDLQGNYCATTKRKGMWPAKTRLKEGAEYKNPTAKQIFC